MNVVDITEFLEYDDLKVRELNEILKFLDEIDRKIMESIYGHSNED